MHHGGNQRGQHRVVQGAHELPDDVEPRQPAGGQRGAQHLQGDHGPVADRRPYDEPCSGARAFRLCPFRFRCASIGRRPDEEHCGDRHADCQGKRERGGPHRHRPTVSGEEHRGTARIGNEIQRCHGPRFADRRFPLSDHHGDRVGHRVPEHRPGDHARPRIVMAHHHPPAADGRRHRAPHGVAHLGFRAALAAEATGQPPRVEHPSRHRLGGNGAEAEEERVGVAAPIRRRTEHEQGEHTKGRNLIQESEGDGRPRRATRSSKHRGPPSRTAMTALRCVRRPTADPAPRTADRPPR